MKVVVWNAAGRIGSYATGVGKHALNMTCGLSAEPGWGVRLLLSSDFCSREQRFTEPSLMDGISDLRLPFSRKVAELLWRTTRRPRVDRWLDGADWIYCPRELYVPVDKARYAITVHDLYQLEPEYRHLRPGFNIRWHWLFKRALREANLVLAVSEFTKSRLIELVGVDRNKIRVVGNGVEDVFYTVADSELADMPSRVRKPYLLSIGGFTHKKGAVHLLALATELARVAPNLTLVVVGPIAPEYKSAVSDTPNIQALQRGFPSKDMHALMCNAVALLALSEYEGFGIPALEAMAAGVPVIAARRASLPEVVGEAGILVEPQQARQITEAVLDLLNDRNLYDALAAKGRKHAEQYRWPSCVNRLKSALQTFGP